MTTNISRGFPVLFLPIFLAASLAGCASSPDVTKESQEPRRPLPTEAQTTEAPPAEIERIDVLGLQRSLGLDSSKTDLGYREKSFDTCRAGYGFSASRNCRRAYLADVKIQILCRDSDGTTSTAVAVADMRPLSGRTLNWTLASERGTLILDGEGFGQIAVVGPSSRRNQRLKLSVDNDFVTFPAGEARRIVTPKNWCNED